MLSIARSIALVALMFAATGCAQKSPEQQQMDQIRSDASNQAKAIENQAELQSAPLDQQADALSNQAKQAGGYTGKRLQVKADALQQEAKLIREQADKQGDAVKEAAAIAARVAPADEEEAHLRSVHELTGYRIHALDGDSGHLEDFFADETWVIRYFTVHTGHWPGGRTVLLSPERIRSIEWEHQLVHVDLLRDDIKQSPRYRGLPPS